MATNSNATGEATAGGPPAPPPAKKRGKLLVLVALAAGLAGGGYVLGGRSTSSAAGGTETATSSPTTDEHGDAHALAGDAEACTPTTEPHELGPVVDLEAMNVNLAGGHYLRIAVSLELSHDAEIEDPAKFPAAPAKDIVVSTLSGRTMQELSTPTGREDVKAELNDLIVEQYHDQVHEVFVTEFVMQ